jgi:hypothetical protein
MGSDRTAGGIMRTKLNVFEMNYIQSDIGAYEIDYEMDGLKWNKNDIVRWLMNDLEENTKLWTPNNPPSTQALIEYIGEVLATAPQEMFL